MKKVMILMVVLAGVAAGAFAQTRPGIPTGGDFEVAKNEDGVTLMITDYKGSAKNVSIPKELNGLPVTVIDEDAFMGKGLTGVVIPEGVIAIKGFGGDSVGRGAFACNQLTSVTIPKGVTTIGMNAFRDNQLTSVTIPNSVTTIGMNAFRSNQLTSVTIPDSVTKIEEGAFEKNPLTSLVLGKGLTYLLRGVFRGNKLTSITIKKGEPSINTYAGFPISTYAGFEESFVNFYISQGYTPGTYVKNGLIWHTRGQE
jgi:hypothetical protein